MKILTYLFLAAYLFIIIYIFNLNDLLKNTQNFLLVFGTVYLVYFLLVFTLTKAKTFDLKIILSVFAISAFLFLLMPTNLSTDIYRYIWDGWLLSAGHNPYFYTPNTPPNQSFTNIEFFKIMDHKEKHPPYPPLAELIFLVSYYAYYFLGLLGAKLVFVFPIFALFTLTYKLIQKNLFALLLLNPVLLLEVFYSGHIDSYLVLFFFLAFLFFNSKRYLLSALFLGFSILIKIFPVIFLPVFAAVLLKKKQVKTSLLFGLVTALVVITGYVPFITNSLFPITNLSTWVKSQEFNAGIYRLLYESLSEVVSNPHEIAKMLSLILLLGITIFALFKKFTVQTILIVTIFYFSLIPSHYPWYSLFLIPLVFYLASQDKNNNYIYAMVVLQFLLHLTYFDQIQTLSIEEKLPTLKIISNLFYLVLFSFLMLRKKLKLIS